MNRQPSFRRLASIAACLAGLGLVAWAIIRLLASDDWPDKRDVSQVLARGLGLVIAFGVVGYIVLVHRWLVRAAEVWLPRIEPLRPHGAIEMRDKFKTWALYTLGGGVAGATSGILFFVIVRSLWALMSEASHGSRRAGGDPVDGWAAGIATMIVFAVVTLPFALAGLQIGIRAASRRLNHRTAE